MSTKGKAASTSSSDDVKPITRASVSVSASAEEPTNSQLMDMMRAEFA
jgi:hypothetical protein